MRCNKCSRLLSGHANMISAAYKCPRCAALYCIECGNTMTGCSCGQDRKVCLVAVRPDKEAAR
jgi:phage FluMu protein Com